MQMHLPVSIVTHTCHPTPRTCARPSPCSWCSPAPPRSRRPPRGRFGLEDSSILGGCKKLAFVLCQTTHLAQGRARVETFARRWLWDETARSKREARRATTGRGRAMQADAWRRRPKQKVSPGRDAKRRGPEQKNKLESGFEPLIAALQVRRLTTWPHKHVFFQISSERF